MFLLRLADVRLENIAAHKFNLILLCVLCAARAACPAPVQSTGETVFSEVFFLNHLYNHTLNFNASIISHSQAFSRRLYFCIFWDKIAVSCITLPNIFLT